MTCEHCSRNPCGCVVVSDGTRYAPARRICGEVFDAGGYPQGCTREPHEGDDHMAEPVRRGPAFASLADLRAIGLASDDAGGWPRMRELFPWLWSDPLSFIGRAANEGQS